MRSELIHPKAYLVGRKNLRKGVFTRSKIIKSLEKGEMTIRQIQGETGLRYSTILYHLNFMQKEKIIRNISSKRPFHWKLTGFGQQKLMNY